MKITSALLGALCLTTGSLRAQITVVDPAYQPAPFLTHSNADAIVSYDWGSNGSVYYQTAAGFNFGGLYQYSGSAPTQVVSRPSDFSGASVVAIGDYIYFNTSDIFKYSVASGGPAVLASSTTNYSLHAYQGDLYLTGYPGSGPNHIYFTGIGANGDLLEANPARDLGPTSGFSGPLAFDLQGNLFYAPGFGDLSIFRWSKAEVDAAKAGTPLADADGHRWLIYTSRYGGVAGGTSMLIDQTGHLLLTLTSFSADPSVLASFGIASDGSFDGNSETLLEDTDRLGELRLHDGSLFLSSGNQIFQIVPEPSVLSFALAGALVLIIGWSRRRVRG